MDATPPAPDAPWPLRRIFEFSLTPQEKARALALAQRHLRDRPNLSATVAFGGGLSAGYMEAPTLFLEDHRAIELMPPERAAKFEYRSLGLAGTGDHYLLSRPRVPDFERYIAATLGVTPTFVTVDRGDPSYPLPLAVACLRDEAVLAMLVEAARSAGGLNLSPFLSTGHVWRLGAEIARRSGMAVRIMGPPPPIATRANNKLWFTAQVRQLLGGDAAPPTFCAFGPAAATALLTKIARHYPRVVVKLPSSAGSMGNVVLDAKLVRERSAFETRALLLGRLHDIGWLDRYPILIGVWEANSFLSPSVQMWLPERENGPPIVEGLFVQSLLEERHTFIGATTLATDDPFCERLVREAMMIAFFLQHLRYVGPLSLDALLIGEDGGAAQLHWIEGNARWSGVSIPMTIASRLHACAAQRSLVVVQREVESQDLPEFGAILDRLAPHLWDPVGHKGLVFTEPAGPPGHNISFFVVGPDAAYCEHAAATVLDTLVGPAIAEA